MWNGERDWYNITMTINGDDNAAHDLRTLEAIGRIYCNAHHQSVQKDAAGLCPLCREAVDATFARTEACPMHHVGNCQDCAIHCHRGESQRRIKEMMRYSAPRMALRHPLMTVEYLRKKSRDRKRQNL